MIGEGLAEMGMSMTIHPQLQLGLKTGVYWITKRIAIGQFASTSRCEWLRQQGITHILNVADAEAPPASRESGFRDVLTVPIADLEVIALPAVLRCVDFIHDSLATRDTKLYVQCIAGQNRSPTILWLFLLASGMDPDAAKRIIVDSCPDSVPGHSALVDDELVAAVRAHGLNRRICAGDPSAIEPAY